MLRVARVHPRPFSLCSAHLRGSVRVIRRSVHNVGKEDQVISGSTGRHLPPVKPLSQWAGVYKATAANGNKERATLFNMDTARKVVQSYGFDKGPPKTVIEIYPSPGLLTRAMLELPPSQLEKLIVMEFTSCFHPELEELAASDDRLTLIKGSGFLWESYAQVEEEGLLDHVPRVAWDQVHPSFRLVGHLPWGNAGEQLISQFIRYIPEKTWLWAYGRVPLNLLMTEKLSQRIIAPLNRPERCKLSVLSEASVDFTETISPKLLKPYSAHFFPQKSSDGPKMDKIKPFTSVSITPNASSLINSENVEVWDFITRALFAQRKTPIKRAIGNLAPGATVLLDKLPDMDPDSPTNSLTAQQIGLIVEAFKAWPFAPDVTPPITIAELRNKAEEKR